MSTQTAIIILQAFQLLLLVAAAGMLIWLVFLSVPGWLGGPPFVPARKEWVEGAIRLAAVKPGEMVFDLGSGDGRLLTAASKAGANVVGYEINPFLVAASRLRLVTRKSGSSKIVWGDYRRADLSGADVVFVYGQTGTLAALGGKLEREMKPGARLISIRYPIAGRKIDAEGNGVYLYLKKG
jgi:SAM-dependent methyltransferase